MFFRSDLITLPTELIVYILQFIPLQTCLSTVSRVCRNLHDIVECSPVLWRDVQFDCHVCVDAAILRRLLTHCRKVQSFILPHSTTDICSPYIDYAFTSCKFDSLVWLDLSQAPISTLCFVFDAPKLEIINVSECENLQDTDFVVLQSCINLEKLYVSFTQVSGETLKTICFGKPLCVIDACAVGLTIDQCRAILTNTAGDVVQFNMSIKDGVNETEFKENVEDIFVDTCIRLYRK